MTFSDDVHMKFRTDACTKIVCKKGKLVPSRNLILDVRGEIQELEHGKTYMYSTLGLRRVRYAISTSERKLEEGICVNHKIKKDTEIRVECRK
jgi:hypothetical protein